MSWIPRAICVYGLVLLVFAAHRASAQSNPNVAGEPVDPGSAEDDDAQVFEQESEEQETEVPMSAEQEPREAVDSEAVDSEAVDSEAVDSESGALEDEISVDANGNHPTRVARQSDIGATTIQHRFATKQNTLAAHVLATAHFRGDFYNQIGLGASIFWYPGEDIGLELRGVGYYSWLNESASQIRRVAGYLPDTRARQGSLLGGLRFSLGYGKIQIGDAFVLHFDPEVVVQGGVTFAEDERFIPALLPGFSVLLHFQDGLQARIDLLAVLDLEERDDRGVVPSIGFAPALTFGWRLDYGAL